MQTYVIPDDTSVSLLKCEEAFNALSDREKLYAHYLSKAAWSGFPICVLQKSPESPLIFSLILKLFRLQSVDDFKNSILQQGIAGEPEITAFLIYSAAVLHDFGNYRCFGKRKITPNLPKEKFRSILLASKFAQDDPEHMTRLLMRCFDAIYSLSDKERQLGFPEEATTTYLSSNVTKQDNDIVNEFLTEKKLEVVNTRLFKTVNEAGQICYEIRLASILENEDKEDKAILQSSTVNNHKFDVTRGDYSSILPHVCKYLKLASKYALNENEEKMIENHALSFLTGSIDAHKDASRFWIKDKSPIVECYIGFIETYNDPAGRRAEFRGFVALVNKNMSAKFEELVKSAEELLLLLPWPRDYEKDTFLKPDFTSLDVLAFSGSCPAGTCIPNYDEIRQNEGFKNLSFGNVIRSRDPSDKKTNFVNDSDNVLIYKYADSSFELQVGLHELLGHGSGKLFCQRDDGSFNFPTSLIDYESSEVVSSWYKSGETCQSVFGSVFNPFEECRAECVGLYLSTVPQVAKIFGYEGNEADDVVYINWLSMALMGLFGIDLYDPITDSWLQAHTWARHVILQVLLEAGENFVTIEKRTGEDGLPDLLLTMDRSKINTVGKQCMGEFLKKLQLYKATANKAAALALLKKYSVVSGNSKYPFLEFKQIIVARRTTRCLKLQCNTFLEDGKVILKQYDPSIAGLIESFTDRFKDIETESLLEEMWEKNKVHFS